MKLKLFDKYILNLITLATILGFVIFIVIWISPEIMFKIIQKVIDGEYTPYVGFKLFWLEIPAILCKIAPMSLLFATLVIVDNLSRNFELVIFRSIGVSFFRLVKPIIVLGLLVGICCFFVSSFVVPYSMKKISTIKNDLADDFVQFTYLEKEKDETPKQLIILTLDNKKEKIYFINAFQITADEDAKDSESSSLKKIIIAADGYFTDNGLFAKAPVIYEISPNGIYTNKAIKLDEFLVLSGKSAVNAKKLLAKVDVRIESLSHKEIMDYINLLNEEQISDQYNAALNIFYQRFVQIIGCVIFAICGVVLGWSRPRENRFLGFTIGALIMLLYYITMPFINVLAEKSILPPLVTAILPLVIISIGTFCYAKYKQI